MISGVEERDERKSDEGCAATDWNELKFTQDEASSVFRVSANQQISLSRLLPHSKRPHSVEERARRLRREETTESDEFESAIQTKLTWR